MFAEYFSSPGVAVVHQTDPLPLRDEALPPAEADQEEPEAEAPVDGRGLGTNEEGEAKRHHLDQQTNRAQH